MTENEAIKFIGQAVIESGKVLEKLQNIKSEAERIGEIGEYYAHLDNCVKEIEACKVAMIALTDIQAYRAIGTVEGYERAIESSIENYNLYKEYKAKVQEFEAIGTVEEFKTLKEKSVAKKVVSKGQGHEADCYCPNCNAFLGNDQDFCFSHTNYCTECGQALET